ncbi:MAG: hypothetical protein WC477_00355 [Patescibacteria group bacterium]
MFSLEKVIQLKDHEEIRLVAKRHIATIFWQLFGAFLLIGFPFFFLFQIFATGPAGLVMFILLIVAGLFWAWRAFILWDGDVLIVSTARVIKTTQSGLFARVVNEMPMDQINSESSWSKKGIASFVWNYGTIKIGKDAVITAKAIPRPHEVFDLIQDMASRARKSIHEGRLQQISNQQSAISNHPPVPLIHQPSIFEQREITSVGDRRSEIGDQIEDEEELPKIEVRDLRFSSNPDHQELKSLDDV